MKISLKIHDDEEFKHLQKTNDCAKEELARVEWKLAKRCK